MQITAPVMLNALREKIEKMSLLILQIVIKQWDKSQRTEAHDRLRATIPDNNQWIQYSMSNSRSGNFRKIKINTGAEIVISQERCLSFITVIKSRL
jgi:hypothetical protein